MKNLLTLMSLGILVLTGSALAVDLNGDGIDDSFTNFTVPSSLEVGDIAVINTGGGVGDLVSRIGALGYSISTIPMDSELETLLNYSVVILPVSHAALGNYATFDALADDYHMYVNSGGGLWIGQPNPFQMPDNTADITWAPYALTVHNGYDLADCPPVVSDDTHCITNGMSGTVFSFPADTALSYADDWQVLVVGNSSGMPGVMFAEYGSGKVLVELGHPSSGSLCPVDDTAFQQYLECLAGGTVATMEINWGSLKTYFR